MLDPRTQVLVATILGSSMAAVDASVVNVALPRIGRDLGLGLAGREWVFLSYSLVLASLYLLAGGVGDRVGQRRVFVAERSASRPPRRSRAWPRTARC